ncbi:hypothetical protein TSUD_257590 [Trifolium subterraneum]|uniref:Endonuclease/exonuclease/phosphatase domain-containing protein n=1 Tax=Trifolium subterraneum TaxID=3900 RepID=A0A2Z6MNF5_TRISU|nr:hypothetical protein TSUD_257590 [Trifolium subterraneum]
MSRSLSARKTRSSSSISVSRNRAHDGEVGLQSGSTAIGDASRSQMPCDGNTISNSISVSPAVEVLNCDSISSSDIPNCNKLFIRKHDQEVATKVWKGALKLGVEIVSLNMRGWGGSAKRRRLSSFLQKGAFDVCLLQETKKADIEDFLIHNLWGHKDVNWVAKNPTGLSGGMLIIWNFDFFSLLNSYYGDGYLGIRVDREGDELNIVNVYSPCIISGKKKLWEDLLALKQSTGGGKWCVRGDFNSILHSSERKGSSIVSRQNESSLFNRFVEEMELIDTPVLGKKFSWFSADGKSMSRIDRFLLSDGFVSKFGITGKWIGDRDISYHCPIWLLCSSYNWGPKPFRVINGWMEHPDFFDFVETTWKSFDVHGKKGEVYGFLDLNIEKTVTDINVIENLLGGDDEEIDLTRRAGLNKDFWKQLIHKESLLKQKSRMRWVKEGDSNSKFFHESIKSRRRRNQLVALKDGDRWVQGVDDVKAFVKNYFENNFREDWAYRPNLNGIAFQSLSEEDNLSLMAPFSIDEVREVIWSSDWNKCPGPDGINFNFLKACWEIIKGDIMEFIAPGFILGVREFRCERLEKIDGRGGTIRVTQGQPGEAVDAEALVEVGNQWSIKSWTLDAPITCMFLDFDAKIVGSTIGHASVTSDDSHDVSSLKRNCPCESGAVYVLMVFPLYHGKGRVIAKGFRTTHGHWLTLMQVPSEEESWDGLVPSAVYSLWWSMII